MAFKPQIQKAYHSAQVSINPKLLYFIFFVVLYYILNRNIKFFFSRPSAVPAGDGAGEDEAGAGEQHHGHPQPRPQPHLQAPRLHPGLHHNRHHTTNIVPPSAIHRIFMLAAFCTIFCPSDFKLDQSVVEGRISYLHQYLVPPFSPHVIMHLNGCSSGFRS